MTRWQDPSCGSSAKTAGPHTYSDLVTPRIGNNESSTAGGCRPVNACATILRTGLKLKGRVRFRLTAVLALSMVLQNAAPRSGHRPGAFWYRISPPAKERGGRLAAIRLPNELRRCLRRERSDPH